MDIANLKTKLLLLQIASFLVSIAPIVVAFGVNWNRYTSTPSSTVKLCIGGAIALAFAFLITIGKLRIPKRIVLFGIVFFLSYLLEEVVKDIVLLSGMAFLGSLIDTVFFSRAIKKTQEAILVGKTANATTQQVEEVIKKYIGNGRT